MTEHRFERFGGRNVLFVMAVDAEYGVHLRKLFEPLFIGVGPVEAGVAMGAELARLAAQNASPDLVVSLGSAGSRSLEHAEVYQATEVSYRDMDASPLGFPKGETPMLGLPATLPLPMRIPDVAEASLSTGANVVSGDAYDRIDADMVDMETYAVLRACMKFDVPLIALRGISDGRSDLAELSDWTRYLHLVDDKLAKAVLRLEVALNRGELPVVD